MLENKQIYSLSDLPFFSQDCLTVRGMQALPALPESLSIIEMGGQEGSESESRTLGALYLNIGLQVKDFCFSSD